MGDNKPTGGNTPPPVEVIALPSMIGPSLTASGDKPGSTKPGGQGIQHR